jgi:cell division protein FtsB
MRIPVISRVAVALGLAEPEPERERAPRTREESRRRARRAARTIGIAGGAAGLLVAVGIGVFPTRMWLDQRAATAEAEQRLSVLREQNEVFEARLERLDSDEEIERLAREQYNLVLPGEEAYAILPPPLPALAPLELWPFGELIGE